MKVGVLDTVGRGGRVQEVVVAGVYEALLVALISMLHPHLVMKVRRTWETPTPTSGRIYPTLAATYGTEYSREVAKDECSLSPY